MRKYAFIFSIGVQNTLVYRFNFFFRSLFALIPLTAVLSVWQTIYASQPGKNIAGYTLAQMISYYLAVTFVDMLTAVAEDDWQIAADIKDGRISQFLLKPMDYLTYRLCLFGAGRLIYTSAAVLPVAVFLVFYWENVVFPAQSSTWLLFGCSLFLTALLQFLLSYTMALLAFWLQEVSTFIFILFAFEYIAGGHLFPLDILPPALTQVLMLTPFPYQLYFPVNIYLERIQGAELVQGLVIQSVWVLIAYGLARWVWARGIKHYEAVGV